MKTVLFRQSQRCAQAISNGYTNEIDTLKRFLLSFYYNFVCYCLSLFFSHYKNYWHNDIFFALMSSAHFIQFFSLLHYHLQNCSIFFVFHFAVALPSLLESSRVGSFVFRLIDYHYYYYYFIGVCDGIKEISNNDMFFSMKNLKSVYGKLLKALNIKAHDFFSSFCCVRMCDWNAVWILIPFISFYFGFHFFLEVVKHKRQKKQEFHCHSLITCIHDTRVIFTIFEDSSQYNFFSIYIHLLFWKISIEKPSSGLFKILFNRLWFF